jgi:hypothetical protein
MNDQWNAFNHVCFCTDLELKDGDYQCYNDHVMFCVFDVYGNSRRLIPDHISVFSEIMSIELNKPRLHMNDGVMLSTFMCLIPIYTLSQKLGTTSV